MTDPFNSDGAKAPPKPFTVEEGRRRVRSFVLRQGRFTPAQQRAFDELWPRFGLDYTGEPRDFDAVFGRQAPRVREPEKVDVYGGKGMTLVEAFAHSWGTTLVSDGKVVWADLRA